MATARGLLLGPGSGPRARGLRLDRSHLLSLPVVVLFAYWLTWGFDLINNLAPVRQRLAIRNGERVLGLERSLHIDPEHALDRWLAAHGTLCQIVVFWYENVHIVVTLSMLLLLWLLRRDLLPRMLLTLVIINVVSQVVFWSFPTAPARMLAGGYVDLVSATEHLPVWHLGATALHSNQLCSMPSLHIAWATWSSVAVWSMTRRRWLRICAFIYPFITTFAVMATGNHYLLDAAAGAFITLAGWRALAPVQGLEAPAWVRGVRPARAGSPD